MTLTPDSQPFQPFNPLRHKGLRPKRKRSSRADWNGCEIGKNALEIKWLNGWNGWAWENRAFA